jgi:hypothetical protein
VPIPLNLVKPYAYFEAHGTLHGWLRERRDETETELPRLLRVDPI